MTPTILTLERAKNKPAIVVRSPFAMKDILKALPAAWWEPSLRGWTYPASAPCACEIIGAVQAAGGQVQTDAGVNELTKAKVAADYAFHLYREGRAQELGYGKSKTAPWPHQNLGYGLLHVLPAVMLAWDMGAGKTKPVVDWICNSAFRRVLIVSPLSVVSVWPKEFQRHGHIPAAVLALDRDTCKGRAKAGQQHLLRTPAGTPAVVVVNYDAVWQRDLGEWVQTVAWDAIICDESHRIKSPSGKASKFLAELGAEVAHRVCLTGTPLHHDPLDIYGQYRFLDPGVFGRSFVRFRGRYATFAGPPGEQWVAGYQNLPDLQARMFSIAHRVDKADVLSLPPFVHETRNVQLTPETRKVYDAMEAEFIAEVEGGEITASNALVKLLRLQQISGGWAALDGQEEGRRIGSEKAKALADLLEDLPQDEPVIVFCRFTADLDAVRDAAKDAGRGYYELSGRHSDLAAWQAGTDGEIIGVQIRSGGLGVDLTRARYAVYYSVGFSLGDFEQSLARLHRPGQSRNVVYVHLVSEGTVDEDVYSSLNAHRSVVEGVMGSRFHKKQDAAKENP